MRDFIIVCLIIITIIFSFIINLVIYVFFPSLTIINSILFLIMIVLPIVGVYFIIMLAGVKLLKKYKEENNEKSYDKTSK